MKKIRSTVRSICSLLGAILIALYLHGIGWPWWAWLPAAILGAMTVYMMFVLGWFLWRKLTYEAFARSRKRRHRASED